MRSRVGTTLVELVVVLVVIGLLSTTLTRALDRSLRFSHTTSALLDQRAQLATAASVARELLADLAPTPSDIAIRSDTALVAMGTVAHGVICRSTATTVTLAPEQTARGTLASFTATPQPGDSADVWDDSATPSLGDDLWRRVELQSATLVRDACAGTPYVQLPRDAGLSSWTFTVRSGAWLPRAGTALRIVRPQRVALYRSAGEWMMGITDWDGARGTWNVIQPLAGRFAPPSTPAGLQLLPLDSLGTRQVSATGAAALSLTLRSTTTQSLRADGYARVAHQDSLRTTILLRNRR